MWPSIALICIIHLISINHGPRWLFYLSKPAPVVLMIAALCLQGSYSSPFGLWVIAGLAASILGDLFLMHPRDKFFSGLSCFVVAHLAYFFGFSAMITGPLIWWAPIVITSGGILVYLLLLPSLGNMKMPVAMYVVVIVLMTIAAAEYRLGTHSFSGTSALLGAVLFMVSDLVLALDRFHSTSRFSRHVVMATYFSAQTLITYSVLIR